MCVTLARAPFAANLSQPPQLIQPRIDAMKIYVASSWRNTYYQNVVETLRTLGFPVWDWRNPPTGGSGFRWQDAGFPDYKHGDKVTAGEWNKALHHPAAATGFAFDLCGMNWADVGILLHPCGKSAHLEAGWMAGRGKKVNILMPEPVEPDLMILALNGFIYDDLGTLIAKISK